MCSLRSRSRVLALPLRCHSSFRRARWASISDDLTCQLPELGRAGSAIGCLLIRSRWIDVETKRGVRRVSDVEGMSEADTSVSRDRFLELHSQRDRPRSALRLPRGNGEQASVFLCWFVGVSCLRTNAVGCASAWDATGRTVPFDAAPKGASFSPSSAGCRTHAKAGFDDLGPTASDRH